MKRYRKLIWASVTHFMIDFICAWMIVNRIPGSEAWFVKMLAYNFFAFAGQLPAGVILDRLAFKNHRAAGAAASAGCLLCLIALIAGMDSYALVITAGIGNALFHVGSGAEILEIYKGRAAGPGIFVSTGALGIYAGSVIPVMKEIGILSGAILSVLLIYSLIPVLAGKEEIPSGGPAGGGEVRSGKMFSSSPVQETIAVLCLVLVVAFRSFEGSVFTFPWNRSIFTGIALTGTVFLGKMLGGFASDRFGSYRTAAVSLAISAVLLGVSDRTGAGLAGVLLFNMTMPVTLVSLYRKFPGYPGTSFGLLTFALYLGVLPVFAGVPECLHSPAAYAALTVVSLILITAGLGLPLQRRNGILDTRNRREML